MFNRKRPRKQQEEVNAGSMADIAFLLLIFFLVATTITNEKGLSMKLPPDPENQTKAPANERNVFNVKINSKNSLLVEGEVRSEIGNLQSEIERFIMNNGEDPNSSVSPAKAIVSLKTNRGTDYKMFIEILDERTLAIPDRPGNNRLDTLSNIVSNPSVALLFIVPGFDDTMRINGQASITKDPAVLERMRVQDRLPKVAIIVKIETVFIHCAKAFRRSKLWDPAQHQDRGDLPSLIKIVMDQTAAPVVDEKTQRDMDEGLEEAYRTTMY